MRVRVPPPLLFLFLWATAWAHEPGLSRAELSPNSMVLTIDREEFADRFPTADLEAAQLLLLEHTLAQTSVRVDGRPCDLRDPSVSAVDGDGIALRARLACPPGERWLYDASWLRGRESGHRHRFEANGHPVAVLDPSTTEVAFDLTPVPVLTVLKDYVLLGIQHILTGFDHLALVLGLLVVVRGWRDAFWLVTGFTLAHSVTLSAAALGVIPIASRLVEPLIALTVVGIAVENWMDPPVRRRLVWTVAIGLIHGLGFAGLLLDLGLPPNDAVLALVSFNVGVEVGQLLVVVVALPVCLALAREDARRRIWIRVSSGALAAAGVLWFLERVMA